MKANKKLLVGLITTGIILVLMLVFLGFVEFSVLLDDNPLVRAIITSSTFGILVLFVTCLYLFVNNQSMIKTLQNDNEYNLGVRRAFNNLYAFQKRVEFLSKINNRHKNDQFIIAFTFSSLAVAQNVNRNTEIYALNNFIANYLEQLPEQIGAKRRDFVYAFSRGSFLLYFAKTNEQEIQNLSEILSRAIYDFGENNTRHIWVQPFFGVAKMNKEETLTHQIENALLARDYSEKNFETTTFYQETFRRSVSSSDIEELNEALEKKEFVVYYQPKFDLANRRFISSEALIRWNSKKYGLLAPTKFLNKAESIGLIHDIDIYVLRQVCEDLNDLIRRGRRTLPVSVNFSLFEFYSANFLDTIMGILEEFNVPPHLIEIEITEATSQANQFLSISIIKKLKENGIRVLMDDFGIGFSNVGNLKKIPFDVVKIDKSFIDGIVTDVKSREIVKFLIGLCKINGMEVVAEGVDNKEQVEILRKAHCDTIQGFYYSQALEKKEFEKFLENNPFEKKEATRLWLWLLVVNTTISFISKVLSLIREKKWCLANLKWQSAQSLTKPSY